MQIEAPFLRSLTLSVLTVVSRLKSITMKITPKHWTLLLYVNPVILNDMANNESLFNYDRTIAGFNITERGIKSYSKSFKLGPFQITLNARESGIRGSIGIPGTGLSKRNIHLFDFQ